MNRASVRSTAFLVAALVGGIVMLMASNLPRTLWWAIPVISIGAAAVTLPVARSVARRSSKFGELEREGIIAKVDGQAFALLNNRLCDFDVILEEVADENRVVIWPFVTAYLRRVYEAVQLLTGGGITNEASGVLQRSVAADASRMAEYISELLAKLHEGGQIVCRYDDEVNTLRDRLANQSLSVEWRGDIAADLERSFE